jgi:hypothetical protein
MEYQVSYEARAHYLLVRVWGQYDPAGAREVFRVVREKMQQGGFTRILLDAMGVSAPPTEFERYQMGEAMADMFPPPLKLAVLYHAIGDNFAQNTALVRGADVLACTDERQALEWLLCGGPELSKT